jgi:hypothetical protein
MLVYGIASSLVLSSSFHVAGCWLLVFVAGSSGPSMLLDFGAGLRLLLAFVLFLVVIQLLCWFDRVSCSLLVLFFTVFV